MVIGTSKSNSNGRKLRSPPADIFVWGMHPETTPQDIVKDLADCDITIEEKDIMKKSKEGAALLSFKVSVRAEDLQKALDPTVWPMRVKVREYVYYPKKKADDSQPSNKAPQNNTQRAPSAPNEVRVSVTDMNVETAAPLIN